jgi:hypothetical protein
MIDHFKRKKPCKLVYDGIELTDEIKPMIISGSYKPPITKLPINHPEHMNSQVTNSFNTCNNNINIIQFIIDGKMNATEVIHKLEGHAKHHMYGHEILYRRLDDIRSEIEEGSDRYTFTPDTKEDLMMLTDKMTKCLDHHTLSDAYYSYDSLNKVYCMRCDEDKMDKTQTWLWKPCKEGEIMSHIMDMMKERVFDDYDTLLCRKYNENPSDTLKEKVEGFYKILKYFLIKPKCCIARHDNEILYYSCDDEYNDHSVGFELSETLNNLFNNLNIDLWQMMNIRTSILEIIEGNAKSAFSVIKERVIDMINLDRDLINNMRD